MTALGGIHHVTAIAGAAQENLDFYGGVLGMRLVKRSVNQDAPGTYHLFYADAVGTPGTDLTFFPWPDLPAVRPGVGLATELSLAVPPGALDFWAERLAAAGVRPGPREVRRGAPTLPLADPHGLPLALVETDEPRPFVPWADGPVPADRQIRGVHAVRLWERDLAPTAAFLTGVLGFAPLGEEGGWHRFGVAGGGSGAHLEVREMPGHARGSWGVGGVHHVAWRVADEAAARAVRERVDAARQRPTDVIDRLWFRSVYFLEPGGALLGLATDGPGFAADEPAESLGQRLVLPPWLEAQRAEIEAGLPPLRTAHALR